MDFSFWSTLSDYSVGGIDFSLPGNGGPECVLALTPTRRAVEDVLSALFCALCLAVGLKYHKRPPSAKELNAEESSHYGGMRLLLLVLTTSAFTMEVTYKLATKQFVFSINPCHVHCLVHMILLAWPSHHVWLTYLFRFNLYFMHGPVLAVVLPVTNTLFLPGELFTYWFEHAMLLLVPLWLLRRGARASGGLYTVDEPFDPYWPLMSYGVFGLFHFLFLEPIGLLAQANLNSMLCPAISDPFGGQNWRLYALAHQFVLILVAGKVLGALGVSQERVTMKSSNNAKFKDW